METRLKCSRPRNSPPVPPQADRSLGCHFRTLAPGTPKRKGLVDLPVVRSTVPNGVFLGSGPWILPWQRQCETRRRMIMKRRVSKSNGVPGRRSSGWWNEPGTRRGGVMGDQPPNPARTRHRCGCLSQSRRGTVQAQAPRKRKPHGTNHWHGSRWADVWPPQREGLVFSGLPKRAQPRGIRWGHLLSHRFAPMPTRPHLRRQRICPWHGRRRKKKKWKFRPPS